MFTKILTFVLASFLSLGIFAQELKDFHIAEIMENFHDEEAGFAKIARKEAQHKDVKNFAKKLYSKHKQFEKDVEKLAKKNKIDTLESDLSKTMEGQLKEKKASLKMASKADFDKTFVAQQIEINNSFLHELDSVYIPNTTNPDFKNHLNIIRTNIVENIREAKALQAKL